MLTIENDAITVANIFPRKSAGVWFIKIVIPTAIVVPPTSPAKKRNVRRRGKLVVNVVNSVAMASSTILAIKNASYCNDQSSKGDNSRQDGSRCVHTGYIA